MRKSSLAPMATAREFDHTADIGLEIRAGSPAGVFEAAAVGMFRLVVRPSRSHAARTSYALPGDVSGFVARRGGLLAARHSRIRLRAPDLSALLVAWLRELLYRFSGKQLVLTDFRVERLTARPGRASLVARVHGRPLDPRDRVLREIKAVTYHAATLEKTSRGYLGRVIFDV